MPFINPDTKYRFTTQLAKKETQDLIAYKRMAREKYERRFPLVQYYSFLLPLQAASGGITTDLSVSLVDDLWGETVPDALAGNFTQPHTDPAIDPTKYDHFAEPVDLNVNLMWEKSEKNLVKQGIDDVHAPRFVFLNFQFELLGMKIKPQDKFIWRDNIYEVETYELTGRWFNTDYFLYSSVTAKSKQPGS
jgi:hypothetical protein